MEYTPETVTEGYRLLESHLQRTGLSPAPLEEISMDTLRLWLADGVRYLLDQNMEALLQLCYRIDLSEAQVNRILTLSPPHTMATEFADLIVQRELQKVYFRAKYKNSNERE